MENYFNTKITYLNVLNLLSTQHVRIPNYKCDRHDHLLAVIGGMSSGTSIAMATVLSLFKIPQVSVILEGQLTNVLKLNKNPIPFAPLLTLTTICIKT